MTTATNVDIDGGVASTTLASSITAADLTIALTDGTGYPTGSPNFYIVIDKGLSTQEVVEIDSRSGNTLTVASGGRGADGSTASAHTSGAAVEHVAPASALQEAVTHASTTTGTPHGSAYLTSSDNAATATALETARTIGGVSFDGTANINLPGVNAAGTQDTSGNAATATALETARQIGGVSFDGTANITPTDVAFPAWTTYTPTWGVVSGTTPSIGNGTLQGHYLQLGKLLVYRMRLVFGSTTNQGIGTWTFSLPSGVALLDKYQTMAASVRDSGTRSYPGAAYFQNTTEFLVVAGHDTVEISGSAVSTTPVMAQGDSGAPSTGDKPIVWATGDSLHVDGVLEIA